jgi:predicted nucleotidyltransferase
MRTIPEESLSLAHMRAAVRAACRNHPVARIEVFGSHARGTPAAGSDVDLLVEFLPEATPGLFEMGALQDDLEQKLGCRVDLLSRRAVEKSRNIFRRRAILGNPVTIYAR